MHMCEMIPKWSFVVRADIVCQFRNAFVEALMIDAFARYVVSQRPNWISNSSCEMMNNSIWIFYDSDANQWTMTQMWNQIIRHHIRVRNNSFKMRRFIN